METLKKIGIKLLYPHIAIISIIFPLSLILMLWAMLTLGTSHIVAIIGYVLAAYSLTIVCFRIPDIIKLVKHIKNDNKYVVRFRTDRHLRIKISLAGSLIYNSAYAILQFFIGLYHGSFWFYSMFAYYLILAVIRFFLIRHTLKYKPNEKTKSEILKYIVCGFMMLLLNIALTVLIFFMVHKNQTSHHHEITTIALAAYTFTAFTIAIINFIKYRKYKSPVFSAAKSISLTTASVSIITLEATMLTSFGSDMEIEIRQLFLALTGGVVSIFVVTLAVFMIVIGFKNIKNFNSMNYTIEENIEIKE